MSAFDSYRKNPATLGRLYLSRNGKLGKHASHEVLNPEKIVDRELVCVLPLYAKGSSRLSLSTTPPTGRWDKNQVGWAYVTKDDIKKHLSVASVKGRHAKFATELLEAELRHLNDHLNDEQKAGSEKTAPKVSCRRKTGGLYIGCKMEDGFLL
jgi:hypothetical protein